MHKPQSGSLGEGFMIPNKISYKELKKTQTNKKRQTERDNAQGEKKETHHLHHILQRKSCRERGKSAH